MIRRHVVTTDLAIIAKEEILVVLVLLGGIVPGVQIAKVMMGIDNWHREITRRRQGAEELLLAHTGHNLPAAAGRYP